MSKAQRHISGVPWMSLGMKVELFFGNKNFSGVPCDIHLQCIGMCLTYEYRNFNGRSKYIASVLDCSEDGFVACLVDCHLECHVDTMFFLLDCM
jgi:hypothetical protein